MSPQILAQILRDGKIVDQNIVKLKWLACFEKKKCNSMEIGMFLDFVHNIQIYFINRNGIYNINL